MIISHKYRFIFIKTIKTAGTSIEVYLSPHCGPGDILTPIQPPEEGHQPRNAAGYYNHFSAWGLKQQLPAEIWDSYFKFCVERNPWDRTISEYSMINHRNGGNIAFADYIRAGRFQSSWQLYTDEDDRSLLVDRVVRYEKLDEELGGVFSQLGIPWKGSLDVHAKSAYRSDRRPYQQWYNEEQRAVVAAAFAREIRQFGYAF